MNNKDIELISEIIDKYESQSAILKLIIYTGVNESLGEIVNEIVDNIDNFGEGTKKIIRVLFTSEKFIALQSEDNGTRLGYYFTESCDKNKTHEIFEHIRKDCAVRDICIDKMI